MSRSIPVDQARRERRHTYKRDSYVYLYLNMCSLHSSLRWRKAYHVTSSTSNSDVASISISTLMFLSDIYSSDPHAYVVWIHVCHPAMGPIWVPFLCNIHYMVGMTLFPSMATLGLPWMISRKSRVLECRLTLLPVLTNQTSRLRVEGKTRKTFAQVFQRLTCLHWGSGKVMATIHNLVPVALLGFPKHESCIMVLLMSAQSIVEGKKGSYFQQSFATRLGGHFQNNSNPEHSHLT